MCVCLCVRACTGSKNALYPSISVYKSETSGEFYLPPPPPFFSYPLVSFLTSSFHSLPAFCCHLLFSLTMPSFLPYPLLSFFSTSFPTHIFSFPTPEFPSLVPPSFTLLLFFFTSSFPFLPLLRLFLPFYLLSSFLNSFFPSLLPLFLHYPRLSFTSFNFHSPCFIFFFHSSPLPFLLLHLLSYAASSFPFLPPNFLYFFILSLLSSSFPSLPFFLPLELLPFPLCRSLYLFPSLLSLTYFLFPSLLFCVILYLFPFLICHFFSFICSFLPYLLFYLHSPPTPFLYYFLLCCLFFLLRLLSFFYLHSFSTSSLADDERSVFPFLQ